MKNFFIAPIRRLQRNASPAHAPSRRAECSEPARDTAIEQIMQLDTLTSWPTHRIRNFLTTQPRHPR